jgi:hypothetical protein
VAFFAFELITMQHYLALKPAGRRPSPPLAASRRITRTGENAMRQIASHILVFLVSVSLSGAMLSPAIV